MTKINEETGNCKKCGRKIGGHNIYLHEGFCDRCFFEEFFPEPDYEKAKKEIENRRKHLKPELQEFLGKNESFFEEKYCLMKYFEIQVENKKAVELLSKFLQQTKTEKLVLFTLYDGFITNTLELDKKDIGEKFLSKKIFEQCEEMHVSQSLSDLQSFYLIFGEGLLFLSSNKEMSEIIERTAKELNLDYSLEETKDFAGPARTL